MYEIFHVSYFSVTSDSEFIFEPAGKDTRCIEKIQYQCPLAFSNFCRREVEYQRHEIMKNLQQHFSATRG